MHHAVVLVIAQLSCLEVPSTLTVTYRKNRTKSADSTLWIKTTQYVYLDDINAVKILGSKFLVIVDIMTTWSSATAEKQCVSCQHRGRRGPKPSSPLPFRPLWLHLCVWSNPKATMTWQRTYVKCAVRKVHFKMNRAFKVIQGHPYWCRLESRMVCCPYVQLMPTLFL